MNLTNIKKRLELDILPILSDNYSYIFSSNDSTVVIDPGEAKPILNFLKNHSLTLTHILCTHHHSDHINGIDALLKAFKAEVLGPKENKIPKLTRSYAEQDTFEIGDLSFKVLETPGHTKTHIIYHLPEQNILFTGDTLFGAGCGRLFEGTPQQMFESMQKILQLPEDTLIYFGHEYTVKNLEFALTVEPNNEEIKKRLSIEKKKRKENKPTTPSTLKIEKQTNPFLRTKLNNQSMSEVEAFAKFRELKDSF